MVNCNICKKEVDTGELEKHVKQNHEEESLKKVFKCEQCEFSTEYRGTLKYHINSTH